MEYCEAKTVDERCAHFNAVRPPNTTAGTDLCEKQLEPEPGKSEVALVPINQLPDDVLCYIFALHCREKTDTVRFPFNRSNTPPQITISHVCSIWRDVILNIPSLWNDLEVLMDDTKDGDMLMNIVHDWLYRASTLPCSHTLDFKVDGGIPGALKQEYWYSSIVKGLISQFRFRKLSTPLASTHWTQFLQLPADKLSCIEDLHICCINPPSISNFSVLSSQDTFKKLTKLTSLRLDQSQRKAFDQMVYSEDSVFAHVPWHQLCHIHLSIPTSVLLCFTILQGTSMVLETCSFVVSDCYGPWAEIQSSEPLYCPQLRTLKFEARLHPSNRFDNPPILDPILLRIRIPNLKTLVVASTDQTYRNIISFSTLVVMQDVSNMQLEELGLYKNGSSLEIGVIFTAFPSLKRVEVLGHNLLDNDTISKLGSGLIGPCLEQLIIERRDIDLGKLLRMVKSRSSIGKPVTKHDEWQVENVPTSFRYVKFYRWTGVVPEEYKDIIEEITRCDVQLVVESWT